ncbi:MAG: SUMF1/EgtB/PvdO family nonheme iron enzyme [Thermoguttaceae bacterium]
MLLACGTAAMADTFGTGTNRFTIDFVRISGATNPSSGIPAGDGFTFTGVANDYRMGTYEITNSQWNKFKAAYGTVTGSPSTAYDTNSYYTGTSVPTNNVSWYEAAQFVNWLNTSTGHQVAYKFTGTKGTSNYNFAVWDTADAGYDLGNPYRNKNAFYFLPTEDEWVKAAYWNGTALQDYATKAGDTLFQGNGTNGGWNYYDGDTGPAGPGEGPWSVGSGGQELNGTYDMMGNLWEWTESPSSNSDYGVTSSRAARGGLFAWNGADYLISSARCDGMYPSDESFGMAFRVASVPEPGSITLLAGVALTALLCWWRERA